VAKPKLEKSIYKGTLYHGSSALLNEGDFLHPNKHKDQIGPAFVHTTPLIQVAHEFGRLSAKNGGEYHIYEVAPEEEDTYKNPDQQFPARRHLKPVKIVKHVSTHLKQ